MTAARKLKISITIDSELLTAVDRRAAELGTTRSAIIERWLKQGSRASALARLEEETAAYYDGLAASDREKDASWATAATKAAQTLRFDDEHGGAPPPSGPRRTRRRRG